VSEVTVRVSRPDELDTAGQIVRRAYLADGWGVDAYGDVLADARARAVDADVVVAVDAGERILGSVTFVLPGTSFAELSRPGEAEFRMLGVDPSFRGQGVGEALIRWCLDRARGMGVRRVVLCSDDGMDSAHRLYTRLGFVRRPELDWCPEPGVDLLAFSLDLVDELSDLDELSDAG